MGSINANKLSRHNLMDIVSQIAEAAEYDYEDTYWVDLSDGYYFGGYTEVVEHYTFDATIVFQGSTLTASGWLKSKDGGTTFEFDSIDDIEVVAGDCRILEDYEYDYDRLNSDLDYAFYEYYKSKAQISEAMFIIRENLTRRGVLVSQRDIWYYDDYETARRELERNAKEYGSSKNWKHLFNGKDLFQMLDKYGCILEQVIIEKTEKQ